MVILKLKNMQTGKTIEDRVRAYADIEIVRVDKRSMQFLYRDGEAFHFVDTETFEQIELSEETIGEPSRFLKDGEMADILFFDDNKIRGRRAAALCDTEGHRGQRGRARRHGHQYHQARHARDRRGCPGAGTL